MQIQGQYAPAGSTWYTSASVEESVQVKGSPGLLFSIAATNTNESARFLFLFDNASAASGSLIFPPIPVAAGGQTVVALPFAIPFTAGLRVAASSTSEEFTAAAGDDIWLTALYR